MWLMMCLGLTWLFRRVDGAWWSVPTRGDETDIQEARVSTCDLVWLPDSQAKWIERQQGCLGSACGWDLSWESRIFGDACESSRSCCSHVVAREATVGGRIPGFWSRYAMEHVCLVGFIRRRLDVHRSYRVKSRLCLSLWILDTALSHGGCEMPWSLDPAKKHVWLLMVVCTRYSSLLARDVLFDAKNEVWLWYHVKCNIISNAMCYTMLYILEWIRKRKYRIGTPRTRGLHDLALLAYIHGRIS